MTAENRDTDAPLKLLSLDGGGIRGIASLIILKHLMKRLNPGGTPRKPCDYFDLIGGTSTGGYEIIAIMLGRLRMDVETCIKQYIELSSAAFTPKRAKGRPFKVKDKYYVNGKYDADILASKVCDVVEEYDAGKDRQAKLMDQTATCKVFVCATAAARTRPVRLRSYITADSVDSYSASDCTIWEAARATSAAPTFFDGIQIGTQLFVDGAIEANNPVDIVRQEAESIWPDAFQRGWIQCLVSIGTGVPDLKAFGNHFFEVAETLKNIATETERTEASFYGNTQYLGLKGRYFRFNVDRGLYDVQLDDTKKLAEIEASAEAYLEAPRVKELIRGFLVAHAPARRLLDTSTKDRHMTWLNTVDILTQHEEAKKNRKDAHTNKVSLLAGSGKSVLVSTLIDKLKDDPGSTVIYFYFSFRDQVTQDLTAIKKSILVQLVRCLVREHRKGEWYVPLAFQLLFKQFSDTQSPPDSSVNDTIARLLNELRQTFIVVDALDEFPEWPDVLNNDRASIVEFLRGLCQHSHGDVHVLVSSRRLPDIESAIKLVDLPKSVVLMGNEQVDADIKAFLMDSLRKKPFKTDPWSNSLRKKVAKTLTAKAEGVFRGAALQLLGLRGKDRKRDIEIALGELPEGLSETYKVMLTRIENDGRSKMAMSVLQWLAYSQRPLTLREVSEVAIMEMTQTHSESVTRARDFDVSFDPNHRFGCLWMVRKALSGLISVSGIDDQDDIIDDRDGTVSFSHFTVQEFLQSKNVSPVAFRLDRTAGQWYIMRCCLEYISFYDKFHDAQYGYDTDKTNKHSPPP
ncbi:acyl transferase/acyl hydrolase/lysophospholipase [Podospora aff. communis PSN243]|uniref:Acyl transferase/acyl hydrolase/lysophospholipase n=1 Tax=Podospora aff. communis PSN243 TaxID=3040156 RepID=A0AAV9G6Y8_9PEZI|nr:acyl transferase/acyl hydrolase/lysophospholipase [Podospora aff. communis PSN243]